MPIRFLHAADIHLGFEQYGHKERYNDFARAFIHLTEDAIERQVDFVLLAGDLFHKRSIEPQTLTQAVRNLECLRQHHIPVIGIEGNHERPHYSESYSWLDYLVDTNLLTLLSPIYTNGRLVVDAWQENAGAYIDLPGGIRVIGVKYYGASTSRVVGDLVHALAEMPGPRPAYTILMLHAGLQGILDNYSATLTRSQLDPLREYVNYLALGHIHKPFIQDDWIYNPGSLETNSTAEAEWADRGYFIVDVDPIKPAHSVTAVSCPRRAFELLHFPVDTYHQPEDLYEAFGRYIAAEATPERVSRQPVVEVRLSGVLAFNRADLDISHLEEIIQSAFHPLIGRIRDDCVEDQRDILLPDGGTIDRNELERYVLSELLERDIRRRGDSHQWADMVLQIKRMALGHSTPQAIIAELRSFLNTIPEEDRPC